MTPAELFEQYYLCRPCFICQERRNCSHRQPEVTKAELEWLHQNRPPRIEPKLEKSPLKQEKQA